MRFYVSIVEDFSDIDVCFFYFYLLYEVLCHMLAYDILQSLMVYVEWVINIDAEENRFQD